MREVFIVSDNIVSPLGLTSADNFSKLKKGISGIQLHKNASLSSEPVFASLFDDKTDFGISHHSYTKFEQILIVSIRDALSSSDIDVTGERTALIVSSTKGNIS